MATVILVSSILIALHQVHGVHSHKGSHGLSCLNDFVNTVSCTWFGSPLAPGVDCWVFGLKKTWILQNNTRQPGTLLRSCRLKHDRNSPPGCSFVFENEEFNRYKNMPSIRMECNGTLVETLKNYNPYDHIKMHPPGLPNISSTANETRITWSLSRRPSDFFKSFYFEAQIKQENKTWDSIMLFTQEPQLLISAGKLKGLCQVRVRVKPTEQLDSSQWSDWSPAASWMEGADITPSQDQEWLLGHMSPLNCAVMLAVGLIVIALVLYGSCARRGFRLLKVKSKPVPNPSKYFHTLHSVHGGNLKNWINPSSAAESFFTAQPSDTISPVEVCESWDVVSSTSPSTSSTSALLHFRSCPSTGFDTNGVADNSSSSSSSCFSNMGYFMSSSSRSSARTDPNPVYFTYQDDFHNLHLSLCPPLGTSATYESLKREPQSPDSGFGIGKEDEEAEDDEKVTDGEEEEVCGDHQTPPLLILPFYLPVQMCPPSPAPPPPDAPTLSLTSSDGQQVDVPVVAASSSYAVWPMAGAMCRSSSMHEETCKTGYLTLKELHTTFSNKSI